MYEFHKSMPELRTPITEVLAVCDCGEVRSTTFDGHWTLDQLQPHPKQPESDTEFFRKLGVKI